MIDSQSDQAHTNTEPEGKLAPAQGHEIHLPVTTQPISPGLTGTTNKIDSFRGLPGAAFNTTPIYDAQGALVGLQAPMDNGITNETLSLHSYTSNMGFVAMPSGNPYCNAQNFGPLVNSTYYGYATPKISMTPHLMPPQAPIYQQNPRHGRVEPVTGQKTWNNLEAKANRRRFDTCPTFCSLFAILCCPITIWCSLPALVYSLCAYADYRTGDEERCQHKSDIAKHLVISACVIGLLLCVTWVILAFFYYDLILNTMIDLINSFKHRTYAPDSS